MVNINNFDEQCITYSQMSIINNARLFFIKLSAWFRIYIISRYYGIGTPEESFQRLYSEISGISNLFQMAFDRQSVDEISQLFNRFIFAVRDLITSQLQGNTAAMNQNVNRLYQISRNSSSFLASINPYLNEEEWRNLLDTYIQYTLEEANALAAGNYTSFIQYDEIILDHINKMGDILAQSLYDYLISGYELSPQSNLQCITYELMDQLFRLRMAWNEINILTNMYMLSRYRGIANPDVTKTILNQFIIDHVDRLQQFFGTNLENYSQQLLTYINLIDSLITAQIEGNVNEINLITQLLYQNADQRAASIATLNPVWNETEWRTILYNWLRYVIEQSTTYLTGDYSRNLDIFRTLLNTTESAGDYFARSIFDYLISQQQAS